LFHDFGRILQVGIHNDNRLALCRIHTGGNGDLVAKVARQTDIAIPRIAFGKRLQYDWTGISAAIIYEDRLNWLRKPVQQEVEPMKQHRKHRFLVEHGDHDAISDQLGTGRHPGLPPQ
jgi:hypothetical protein